MKVQHKLLGGPAPRRHVLRTASPDPQAVQVDSFDGGTSSVPNARPWLNSTLLVGGAVALAATLLPSLAAAADVGVVMQAVQTFGEVSRALLPAVMIGGVVVGGLKFLKRGKDAAFQWEKNIKTNFSDVAGADSAKQGLSETLGFFKDPERSRAHGAKMPSGVLLSGPPGTGKSFLARATAGESGLPFVVVSGSSFVDKYAGTGAKRVRELFSQAREQAKKHGGAIIFLDEIDAIGQKRSGDGNNREREATLNGLLVEIAELKDEDNILLMAATNRPELLDPALVRSGRFDRKVHVGPPDRNAREAILKIHARDKKLDSSVDLGEVAKRTSGLVGADLAVIMNEAALTAAREGTEQVSLEHVLDSVERVVLGEEVKGIAMSDEDRTLAAFQQAGKAVVTRALPSLGHLERLSILPRGRQHGALWTQAAGENTKASKEEILDQICQLMASRATEKLKFNTEFESSADDLRKATELAHKLVSEYGMDDKIGKVSLNQSLLTGFQPSGHLASDASGQVAAILDGQFERAQKILAANEAPFKDLVGNVLAHDELNSDQMEQILGRRVAAERAPLNLSQFKPRPEELTFLIA